MESSSKRRRRDDDDTDDSCSGEEEVRTQRGHRQERNIFHGTGIQSRGNFTVGGDLNINVESSAKEQEDKAWEIAEEARKRREKVLERREQLLTSLEFAQLNTRGLSIRKAHASTCQWILTNEKYKRWVQRPHNMSTERFIWLKGKPGTGKSTMMRFLLDHIRDNVVPPDDEEILISFFFNARGVDLEKTTLDLYRSLLQQVLKRRPEVQEVLDGLVSTHEWTIGSLESIFEQAVRKLKEHSMICLIDALDECGELQVRQMVKFFSSLTQENDKFQICFTSRHYPHISIATKLDIILEHQTEHQMDIIRYLRGNLQEGYGPLVDRICSDILAKSSGIFMWVILVVDILNREYDAGKKHRWRERLDKVPEDLNELFRDILTRDTKNVEELLLCIQFISFARRPLAPAELYFATISGLEPEYLKTSHLAGNSRDEIRKYILDNSKGLAEPVENRSSERTWSATVQFIHESVVDFLIKDNGLAKIFPGLGDEVLGKSHDALKRSCLNYIDFVQCFCSTGLSGLVRENYSFVSYATEQFIFHANQAQTGGIDQKDFMEDFSRGRWLWPFSAESRLPNPLYILAKHQAWPLILAYPTGRSCFTIDDTDSRMPIMEAVKAKMTEVVLILLKMEVSRVPDLSFRDLCDHAPQPVRDDSFGDRDFSFQRAPDTFSQLTRVAPEMVSIVFLWTSEAYHERTPLSFAMSGLKNLPLFHAISRHHNILLKHILDMSTDMSSHDEAGRLPVHWAAQYGNIEALTMLHAHGHNIDARDNQGNAPLHYAINRKPEILNSFLSSSFRSEVNMEAENDKGMTPLHVAARSGQLDALRILLRNEADVEARDEKGKTPLHYAALLDQSNAACILLNNKANIEARDAKGKTALFYAGHRGLSSDLFDILMQNGAHVDARDHEGRTALHYAIGFFDLINVQLLSRGADPSAPDNEGQTPLKYALWHHSANPHLLQQAIRLLQRYGADISAVDQWGETLLHWSLGQGLDNCVQELVDCGADISKSDKDGYTPIWWAICASTPCINSIQLLLDHGANIRDPDRDGDTVLHIAVKRGKSNVVKVLVNNGASTEIRNKHGQSPLGLALRLGDEEIIQILS